MFIIFNRADTAGKVFDEIRRARPETLLVIGDAPRPGVPKDVEGCASTRAILDRIDWPCRVLTNFPEANLGPRRRISTGLEWVFREVGEAIILEHDCLPHPSFFPFCEELLERYREEEHIAGIGGNNFLGGLHPVLHSYYFSRYLPIWGWATWRRTWQTYDVGIRQWPGRRGGRWLYEVLGDWSAVEHWTRVFDRVYRGGIDTWDYQLTFANWCRGALSVVPAVNLVANIGFGPEAVHTKEVTWLAGLPREAVSFPLRHPPDVVADTRADTLTEARVFSKGTRRIRRGLQARCRSLFGARKIPSS